MAERQLLTHTKRSDFLRCPRYFFHRHEQRLQVRAQKPGRRKGTIFGDALQACRDHREAKGTLTSESVTAALDVVNSSYAELEESGEWVRDQEDADNLEIEHQKMLCVVPAYINRYRMEPRREVEFHLPLFDPTTGGRCKTFDLAGKLDGMEIVGHRTARVVEDKLVAQVQRAMIERLPLDAQTSEYVDALWSKGWSAEVAYRHTKWPGINPLKAKEFKTKDDYPGESMGEFRDRLAADMTERQDFYFDEQILTFPRVHLDDYRRGRWGVARMIMDSRVREAHKGWQAAYPMNPSRCWEYGGCEFIPLCTKQPDAIDRYEVTPDNSELSLRKEG